MDKNSKVEEMKRLRSLGFTYEEIGMRMSISKQRVYQLIGDATKHKVNITENQCVYPNLRQWMNEHNVSINYLSRMMYGELKPARVNVLKNALRGSNCTKHMIDQILQATGLSYEVAFSKDALFLKSCELCNECEYSVDNCDDCDNCDMYASNGDCKCTRISEYEHCPYFKKHIYEGGTE